MLNKPGLNKRLILRLILVWLSLSSLIGVLVYYLELADVDEYVVELVVNDAKTFDRALIDLIDSPDQGQITKLQRKADSLIERHYSLVDVYDLNQAHVVTAERELDHDIRNIIEPRHHQLPLDRRIHFDKFSINGQLYLQVLVPLKNSQSEVAGYFEGVYLVEDEVLSAINRRIYRTLLLVVVSLLACAVVLYPVILRLNQHLYNFSKKMLHANLQLMDVLGNAIAVRDETTNSHNYRVTLYAVRIGEAVSLNHKDMRSLIAGSFLHDVGKIGIRDEVLRKPHGLNEAEQQHMREHVLLGLDVVGNTEWLEGARDVIEFHHERFDGSGYMGGLKGVNIPLIARIFAIADVFDALTTKRDYKEAYDFTDAMNMMWQEKGKHFDPWLLTLFKGFAAELYKQIHSADDATLENILTQEIDRYFFEQQLYSI
ncbi:MAG: HD domain-containing protein [Gammaproteobacteria bacterium]|nr:HD domain-containing protein [Gammaproteobacteria bacterium]MDH5801501.1 HD domain-containing protein [Gammaproteobacteria bacterium]